MKRVLVSVLGVFLLAGIFSDPAAAARIGDKDVEWEMSTAVKVGRVYYEEDISILPLESDWDATFAELEFGVENRDYEGWDGGADIGLLFTSRETETWHLTQGGAFQSNEMKIDGWDLDLFLGRPLHNTDSAKFTPGVAYGYRGLSFNRRITNAGRVEEDYSVHHLDLYGLAEWDVAPTWNLELKGNVGFVPYAEADNSIYGKFDTSSGWVAGVELTSRNQMGKNWGATMGVFYDYQKLSGEQDARNGFIVEWPDSQYYRWGAQVGLNRKF
ncbi:MAG: hypothetical protein JW937_08820 [Candidatus Omnitrophica bacterium]|nr:hypothetical protein [Candidatus Omnitrophota bacterium]